MKLRRLAMGAAAIAAVVGMATGPMEGAGAATRQKAVYRTFNVNCPSCVNVQGNLHWSNNGYMHVAFRDAGYPGDSFKAIYVDMLTGQVIPGRCAPSSKQYYYDSLVVHIPSSRNFKIRIKWCSGPGYFPAGGSMRITP